MIDVMSYATITAIIFLINTVPALAPPSWLVLSLYKVNNPGQDVLTIALLGVVGSVLGRCVMYLYSSRFGGLLPKKYFRNVHSFRKLLDVGDHGPFLASFFFSLGPLPSNFIFISSGMSGVKLPPLLAGFALGRFISYTLLIYTAFQTLTFFFLFGFDVKLFSDVLGVLATVAVVFVDWRKFVKRKKVRGPSFKS